MWDAGVARQQFNPLFPIVHSNGLSQAIARTLTLPQSGFPTWWVGAQVLEVHTASKMCISRQPGPGVELGLKVKYPVKGTLVSQVVF